MMTANYPSPAQRAQAAPPLRHLRQVLHPDYAMLPHAELAELMESRYGPHAAERYDDYLEGIFGSIGSAFSSAARDVGRFAARAAPVIATVGGGALQGAMAGSSMGLPGIIAGAAVGGAGAGLSRYGGGAARNIGGILNGVTSVAGQFSPAGRVGASLGGAVSSLAGGGGKNVAGAAMNALGGMLGGRAGPAAGAMGGLGNLAGQAGRGGAPLSALTSLFGGGSAAGQLQSLLQRPETQRALAALNLGPLGRPSIPTGSARTPVPATAITNLIGQLSNQVGAEAAAYAGDGESTLYYMTDQFGDYVGDPALESERAERVWELLNEAQAERVIEAVVRTCQARSAHAERMADAEQEELAEDAEFADADADESWDTVYGSEAQYDEVIDNLGDGSLYFDAGESEYFQ